MTKTKAERQAELEAELRAAARIDATVKRTSYRRAKRWLLISTLASFVGNCGHAILAGIDRAKASARALAEAQNLDGGAIALAVHDAAAGVWHDPLFYASIIWATVPPTLLMLAVHGVPLIAHLLGKADDDRVLMTVAWTVTFAAFAWSAYGLVTFTVAVGVPGYVAWLAPVAVDASVFGATRTLVRAAPVMTALDLDLDVHTVTVTPERLFTDPFTPESDKVVTSTNGTRKPQVNAAPDQTTVPTNDRLPEPVNGNVPAFERALPGPVNGNDAVTDRAPERTLPDFTNEHNSYDPFTTEAHDILKRTGKRTPAATVAVVLRQLDSPDAKVSVIAAELGMGERTVREIRDARRPHLVQAAV